MTSKALRYAGAGRLGAAAAATVVAIVVVVGGVKFNACPPGHACIAATSVLEESLARAMEVAARAPQAVAETVAKVAAVTPATAQASSGGGLPAQPWASIGPAAANGLVPRTAAPGGKMAEAPEDTAKQSAAPLKLPKPLTPKMRSAALASVTPPDPSAAAELQAADAEVAEVRADTLSEETDVRPGDTSAPAAVRVVADALNLRTGPSTSADKVASLTPEDVLTPSAQSEGWVKVTDEDGHTGWVDARYLSGVDFNALPAEDPSATTTTAAVEPPAEMEESDPDTRIVGGKGANVRSGPSMKNGTLFALRGGSEVTVLGETRGWLQVTDTEGRKGWIYGDYVHQ
jgi:uncharacterized protein YgiM (DUF1202 family)